MQVGCQSWQVTSKIILEEGRERGRYGILCPTILVSPHEEFQDLHEREKLTNWCVLIRSYHVSEEPWKKLEISIWKSHKGRCKSCLWKTSLGSFCVGLKDTTNRWKLQEGKPWLDKRKNFLVLRDGWQWNGLPFWSAGCLIAESYKWRLQNDGCPALFG